MKAHSAIVTGGSGGIGSVVSQRLAEHGFSVVVADANQDASERLAASLPKTNPAQEHLAVTGDLTSQAVNQAVAEAAAEMAPIAVLVNAVGISPKNQGKKRPFFDVSEEEWDTVMSVNLKAPFLLTKEVYQHMPQDGTASIVNLLSVTAKLATGGLPEDIFPPHVPSSVAYTASKAALQNLTASLSRELASRRIRVNGVAPGVVATAMATGMPEETLAEIPMARFGQPDEVADAIEFLISDKASYITGTSLDVNGGWLTC